MFWLRGRPRGAVTKQQRPQPMHGPNRLKPGVFSPMPMTD
jgi:hypothetical protein